MSACFCIGPQGGDKECPCAMRAKGETPSEPTKEKMYESIGAESTIPQADFSFNLCACMGPRYGDPYCYCEMKRRGLKPTDPPEIEWKQFEDALKQFGWK